MNHLVIIPTYNEAATIDRIVSEVFKLYNQVSILVVDDSSPDGTEDKVKILQEKYDKLFILNQEKKGGLKKAYINGFKWGLKNNFDVFTTLDADFSHNPKYIKTIIEYLNEGYQAIYGSRYIAGGNTQETNLFKNFISIGGNKYLRFVLGKDLYDWTEGFNTYTKEVLDNINLDSILANGYIMHAEMKYKILHLGYKYKEFPINFAERQEGYSKMNFNIIFEAFFYALKLRLGL